MRKQTKEDRFLQVFEFSFFSFISIVLFLLLIVGCSPKFEVLPEEEVRMCARDSECTLVMGAGCCPCQTPINSEYVEYFDELRNEMSGNDCSEVKCPPCFPNVSEARCFSNICELGPVYGEE